MDGKNEAQLRVESMMRDSIIRHDGKEGPSIAMFSRMLLGRNDLFATWALFSEFRVRVLKDLYTRVRSEMHGVRKLHQIDDLAATTETPENSNVIVKRKTAIRRGYAAEPGTGPIGESCGTCKHDCIVARHHKCGLEKHRWTGGMSSDIVMKSPACEKWEAVSGEPTNV